MGAVLRRKNSEIIAEDDVSIKELAQKFCADLWGADLRSADLRSADLWGADLSLFQVPQGDLIVFKEVDGRLVTLKVSSHMRRTASLVGRKCRSERAFVLYIEGGLEVVISDYDNKTEYRVGHLAIPDAYDDDPRIECTHGIHFYLTKEEALSN